MKRHVYDGLEYYESNAKARDIALVLHWGGASGRLGLPFAHLLPGWRVIAPSLPGHGRTRRPVAPIDTCAADILALLARLGITHIQRVYAYSLGAYAASRLFDAITIDRCALLAGGVVPIGIALPHVFAESADDAPETATWLTEVRSTVVTPGRQQRDAWKEWHMILTVLDDIVDFFKPRVSPRRSAGSLRPAIESVWDDDFFAAPHRLPDQTIFWNGNDPVACAPYVERFAHLPGCREVQFEGDPFDVRWDTVRRVIALLEE